jgi:hypothetical protein
MASRRNLTSHRKGKTVGNMFPQVHHTEPTPSLVSGLNFTTAQAALIAGVQWESFRMWRRLGMMRSSGRMASAVEPKRFGGRGEPLAYSFGHLCGFRLAMLLVLAGQPVARVRDIVSQSDVWETFMRRQHAAEDEDEAPMPDQFLVIGSTFDIVDGATLSDLMRELSVSPPSAIVTISLEAVRRNVCERIELLSQGALQ